MFVGMYWIADLKVARGRTKEHFSLLLHLSLISNQVISTNTTYIEFCILCLYDYRLICYTSTMNISEDKRLDVHISNSHEENIVFAVFYTVVFLIAVPGNTFALWAFFHQTSTTPTSVFLRNLSVADISYILILPMRIVYHLSGCHWPFGHALCQLSGFLFYLNMYCSLYLMSLISLDRFLAVVLPIKSVAVRKVKYAKVAVGILWVTVIVSMSPILFSKRNETNSTGICSKLYLEKTSPKALVSTIVAFVIPLTAILVFYVLILLKLRTIQQQDKRPVKGKAIKMIIVIVMNFLFAFVPYHVSRVIYIEIHCCGNVTAANRELFGRANQITSAFTCISGVLDPVMYFVLNQTYRNKVLQLYCKNRGGGQ